MTDEPNQVANAAAIELWVVEATVDVPVQLPVKDNSRPAYLYVSLGGDDPDGFVQMRPQDVERATTTVFWSAGEPIVYECRALVRAENSAYALLRGKELYEHVADRLTVLFGYPVRVVQVGATYSETDLKACVAGEAAEFRWTTGGTETFRTQLPKNSLQQLLIPPPEALEALRWFRLGMLVSRRVDQFLSYYIALESIARHVPGVTRQPRPDTGAGDGELESQEAAAIRYLLTRRNVHAKARGGLARIRARIAHGSTDAETLELASKNLPLLQRIALDGIALVYGVDPNLLNVLTPSPIEFLAPLGTAEYSVDQNPVARWGGLLSEAFDKYLSHARGLSDSSGPPTSEGSPKAP